MTHCFLKNRDCVLHKNILYLIGGVVDETLLHRHVNYDYNLTFCKPCLHVWCKLAHIFNMSAHCYNIKIDSEGLHCLNHYFSQKKLKNSWMDDITRHACYFGKLSMFNITKMKVFYPNDLKDYSKVKSVVLLVDLHCSF